RDLRDSVITLVACLDCPRFVGADVGDGDSGFWNDRARRIGHAAPHGSANALRGGADRERGNRDKRGKQHETAYSVLHWKRLLWRWDAAIQRISGDRDVLVDLLARQFMETGE